MKKTAVNTLVAVLAVLAALTWPAEFSSPTGFIGLGVLALFVCAYVEYIFIGQHREIDESIAKSCEEIAKCAAAMAESQTKAEAARTATEAARAWLADHDTALKAARADAAAARAAAEASHEQWATLASSTVRCRNRLEQQGVYLDNEWNIVRDERRGTPET